MTAFRGVDVISLAAIQRPADKAYRACSTFVRKWLHLRSRASRSIRHRNSLGIDQDGRGTGWMRPLPVNRERRF